MKRVAIYIDPNYQGGVSQYIKSLLNALISISPSNFELSVVYTSEYWDDYLKKHPDINVVLLKKTILLNRLYQFIISTGNVFIAKLIAQYFDRNVKFLDRQGFDFIIFPSSDTIACLVNSNVIGTIHDLMHRYERSYKESGGRMIYYYRENYYKNLLLRSKAVFVDSGLGEKHALESYDRVNSKIFPLPYIAPDYIYSQETATLSPSKYSVENKYLFYPAMFWSHKNHITLIKAIKILKERGHRIELWLGGSKKLEYNRLYDFVKTNKLEEQVKFLGYVSDSDMIYLYRNAFAMVMPSFYGPTNIPPIEAIILDCPPIVSNNYAMPEQFEDAALYFDPKNPIEIANRVESLLNNDELRSSIIQNGGQLKEKFSQKRFESDLKNILSSLLN